GARHAHADRPCPGLAVSDFVAVAPVRFRPLSATDIRAARCRALSVPGAGNGMLADGRSVPYDPKCCERNRCRTFPVRPPGLSRHRASGGTDDEWTRARHERSNARDARRRAGAGPRGADTRPRNLPRRRGVTWNLMECLHSDRYLVEYWHRPACVLVRHHDRRVFSRTRALSGWEAVRRCGGTLLDRLRPRSGWLDRQEGHPLEDLVAPVRRLREVSGRRRCFE